MPSVLFLSPHLDDVAFSCCAALIGHLQQGDEVHSVTLFTGNVEAPKGFALECQTSKNIAPDVDYMALRRQEDSEFCRVAGIENASYWPLLEAPHRGYNSAPELFAGIQTGDEIWRDIANRLRELPKFARVYCPQGLGNHVDHLQTIRASRAVFATGKLWFYRDTPYAIRQPDAAPSLLPPDAQERCVVFDEATLERKIKGCQAYESQIGFQFGGAEDVARKLRSFHTQEAHRCGQSPFAERFLTISEE
jgi:LmbE family N-acetylglucosaminyl deacetylase